MKRGETTLLPMPEGRGFRVVNSVDDILTVEQKFFLKALTTYAIASRYPERKKKLLSVCKKEEAKKILESSELMIKWLKERINERLCRRKQSSEN